MDESPLHLRRLGDVLNEPCTELPEEVHPEWVGKKEVLGRGSGLSAPPYLGAANY